MKNILYLTKILFINSLGTFSSNKEKKNRMSKIGIISLFSILILFLFVPMVYFGIEVGSMISQFDMLTTILKLLLPITSIMIILFSVFSIISTFFLSKDIETLLGLPIKPYEIIIAKFLTSLTTIYLIELMMFTPICIGLGIGSGCNILYYLNIIIVTIFLPFFPLSILGILMTSLMRYSAMSKMKDKIQYFIMILAIIFAIGIQFISQSASTSIVGGEDIAAIIDATFGKTANTFSSVMFFTYPASIALGSSNVLISILSILGFVIISLLGLALFAFIGQKIYIKGILGKPQIKSKKSKDTKVEIKEEKNTSLFKNLISNEWKLMWRSPSFNMNLISTIIIVPIIFVISFVFGFAGGGENLSFSEIITTMKYLLNFDSAYSMAFAIAVFSFFTCFSPVAATAISRDGKHAWYNKVLPIKPMTIIYAKMFWGIVLGYLPVLLVGIVTTIMGIFNIFEIVMILIPLFLLVLLTNFIGIMIDLAKPKLKWDSENAAVKQNINMLFFMLIDWAITALIVLGGVALLNVDLPNFVSPLILTLLFGVSCVILNRLLSKKGLKVFKNIG